MEVISTKKEKIESIVEFINGKDISIRELGYIESFCKGIKRAKKEARK